LYVVSIVTGAFGESHVPQTLLLANDLAGTAHRMATSVGILRASFAAALPAIDADVARLIPPDLK
jgi:hypothetical protein